MPATPATEMQPEDQRQCWLWRKRKRATGPASAPKLRQNRVQMVHDLPAIDSHRDQPKSPHALYRAGANLRADGENRDARRLIAKGLAMPDVEKDDPEIKGAPRWRSIQLPKSSQAVSRER